MIHEDGAAVGGVADVFRRKGSWRIRADFEGPSVEGNWADIVARAHTELAAVAHAHRTAIRTCGSEKGVVVIAEGQRGVDARDGFHEVKLSTRAARDLTGNVPVARTVDDLRDIRLTEVEDTADRRRAAGCRQTCLDRTRRGYVPADRRIANAQQCRPAQVPTTALEADVAGEIHPSTAHRPALQHQSAARETRTRVTGQIPPHGDRCAGEAELTRICHYQRAVQNGCTTGVSVPGIRQPQ